MCKVITLEQTQNLSYKKTFKQNGIIGFDELHAYADSNILHIATFDLKSLMKMTRIAFVNQSK